MVLGICDDDASARQRVRRVCEETISRLCVECNILEFHQGTDVLRYEEQIDVLILDIKMPGWSGIQVKESLPFGGRLPLVIFVTNHRERMAEAFGANVVAFLHKVDMELQLPKVLETTIRMARCFIMIDGRYDSRDVVCVKAENVYCKLVGKNGHEALIRQSGKALERQLAKV